MLKNHFDSPLSTRHLRYHRSFLLALVMTFSSCGSKSGPNDSNDSSDSGVTHARDLIKSPPKAYYDALLSDRLQLAASGFLGKADSQVLWLNFNGASVQQGYNRGQSFIPCKDNVTIAPSQFSSADQAEIVKKVASYYSAAGAKLNVTTEKPTAGDFTTINIGGNYSDLGCSGNTSITGIAPLDTGNANPNDIGFVFFDKGTVDLVALAIAHESGHSFGLDHSDNPADIMYPAESNQEAAFAIGKIESTGAQQNGPALLQANLGLAAGNTMPAPAAPSAPQTTPSATATKVFANLPGPLASLPGLGNLGGMSNILATAPGSISTMLKCSLPGLSSSGISGGVALPNSQDALGLLTILQNAVLAKNGGQFSMVQLLALASGLPAINFNQLMGMAGLASNATQCLSKIIPISIPGITNQVQGQLPTGINVAQIFGIQNITNPGNLIGLLPQYAQVITGNTQGANSQALLSLVMMAITQQYGSAIFAP